MRKERVFIADLRKLEAHKRFEGNFLVLSKEVPLNRNGEPYLSMELADRTGSLEAKMWDNVSTVADRFGTHDIVHVRGKVQDYSKRRQIIGHRLQAVPRDEVSPGDFVPHTEYDVETMYAQILSTIDEFSNRNLRALMRSIFRDDEFAVRYKRSPAAKKNHHAKVGGLLEHVSTLVRLAKAVGSVYAEIDTDLLVCGALLHDVGKVFELGSSRSFDYTDDGRLLGHIAMGSEWVSRKCDEIDSFPPRLKSLVLHLILSHHGKKEFGSPVEPMIPEALALHAIDDLDARLEMMRTARIETSDGEIWSRYHRTLGRYVLDKGAFLGTRKKPARPRGRAKAKRPKRGRNARGRRTAKPAPAASRAKTKRESAPAKAPSPPPSAGNFRPRAGQPAPPLPNEPPVQLKLIGGGSKTELPK